MVVLLALAACGGGGDGDGTGTPPFGGSGGGGGGGPPVNPPTVTVSDLSVQLSAATIPNSGVSSVTLTVTALDTNRNAIPSAPVVVSANNGGVLTIAGTAGSVTDATGRLSANVAVGSSTALGDMTLTAAASGVTRTAVLRVISSPVGAVPTSIELIAAATSVGTGGAPVLVRAFVKDANNNALPNAPVTFATNTGTLSSVSSATDGAGTASANLSAGANKFNRNAVITVTSGTISSQLTLPISGTTIRTSGPSSLIRGASAAFDVVVTDSTNNVVPGVTITPTSTLANPLIAVGGPVSNSNGLVTFTYTATNAGSDALAFAGAGATTTLSSLLTISAQTFAFTSPAAGTNVPVSVSRRMTVRLAGVTPLAGNVVNFAATGGTFVGSSTAPTDSNGDASVDFRSDAAGPVTVQATVASNGSSTTLPINLVADTPSKLILQVAQVSIAPNATASGTNQAQLLAKVTDSSGNPVQGVTVNFSRAADPSGGNLLQASALTDATGVASVTYRSGAQSTGNNGVKFVATISTAPSVFGTANLTVSQTSLFIALGTGNVIDNLDPQTYKKDWVVYVTDSNGVALNNVTLTIKAIPVNYRTGELRWNSVVWAATAPTYSCRSEDRNQNGILDPASDDNKDGVLWPGNVISVTPGTVQTVNGRVTISLIYAESYAPWVDVLLTASATVSGTESKTEAQFIVTGLAADFDKETVPPAGIVSPFGVRPRQAALDVAGACVLVQ